MKLKVIGWTDYDDTQFDSGEIGWAARNAVADDIKAHGYLFSGYDHQERTNCAPVLNDGKIRRFSQRGFGDVMAEAHGYTGRMDYSLFTFGIREEALILPEAKFSGEPEARINLSEKFTLRVTRDFIAAAKQTAEIELDDLPELRYLDAGDRLALVSDEHTEEFMVVDVDRKKDLTEEERLNLTSSFYDCQNGDEKKRAEEIYRDAKRVITVKLKECAHSCETFLRFIPIESQEVERDDGESFDDWFARQTEVYDRRSELTERLAQKLASFTDAVEIKGGSDGAKMEVNRNADDKGDVNAAVKRTIGCFVGKERELKTLCEECEAEVFLVIALQYCTAAVQPFPEFSLDGDVVGFLYQTGARALLDLRVL